MLLLVILIASATLPFNVDCGGGHGRVVSSFRHAGIVPEVIDRAPMSYVSVKYNMMAQVGLGNELTPTQVRYQPEVLWPVFGNTSATYYTLMMVDPDVPTPTDRSKGTIVHWLVGNVKGNDIMTGWSVADYIGAGPPFGSLYHRYIFLVFQQPTDRLIDFSGEPRSTSRSVEFRMQFSVRNFVGKYNLGYPVAGNFFLARYDPTVEILNKEWGI